MYQYLDRPPVTGDIIEFRDDEHSKVSRGDIHIVSSHTAQGIIIDSINPNTWLYTAGAQRWRVIATKPGSEAQPGDTIIIIPQQSIYSYLYNEDMEVGNIYTVQSKVTTESFHLNSLPTAVHHSDFLVLCKKSTESTRDMRSYAISLTNTSLQDRQSLKDHLEALGEVLNKGGNGLLTLEVRASYVYSQISQVWWIDSPHSDAISIADFIARFPLPSQSTVEQSAPIQPTSNLQETSMTFQQLLINLFGSEKPTTDYDRRSAYLVVAYNRDGSQIGTATAISLDAVKKKVASTPELWGCKVLVYSLTKEVYVNVPVDTIDATYPITEIEDLETV